MNALAVSKLFNIWVFCNCVCSLWCLSTAHVFCYLALVRCLCLLLQFISPLCLLSQCLCFLYWVFLRCIYALWMCSFIVSPIHIFLHCLCHLFSCSDSVIVQVVYPLPTVLCAVTMSPAILLECLYPLFMFVILVFLLLFMFFFSLTVSTFTYLCTFFLSLL